MEWSSDLFKETGELDEYGQPVRKLKPFLVLILLTVCLVFSGIGAAMLIADKNQAKSCTEKVTGVVVRNEARESSSDSDNEYVYAPVFEYSFHRQEYTVISNTASNPPVFDVGERVEIYVDPSEPTRIYVPADRTTKIISWIFIGIGAVPAIVIVIIAAAAKRSSSKKEEEEYRQL